MTVTHPIQSPPCDRRRALARALARLAASRPDRRLTHRSGVRGDRRPAAIDGDTAPAGRRPRPDDLRQARAVRRRRGDPGAADERARRSRSGTRPGRPTSTGKPRGVVRRGRLAAGRPPGAAPGRRLGDATRAAGCAASPSRAGRFPLVVFSHGYAGFRDQSTFLTSWLASWGFVVAAPDHHSRDLTAVLRRAPRPARTDRRRRPAGDARPDETKTRPRAQPLPRPRRHRPGSARSGTRPAASAVEAWAATDRRVTTFVGMAGASAGALGDGQPGRAARAADSRACSWPAPRTRSSSRHGWSPRTTGCASRSGSSWSAAATTRSATCARSGGRRAACSPIAALLACPGVRRAWRPLATDGCNAAGAPADEGVAGDPPGHRRAPAPRVRLRPLQGRPARPDGGVPGRGVGEPRARASRARPSAAAVIPRIPA